MPEPGEWEIPKFGNLVSSARGFCADWYLDDASLMHADHTLDMHEAAKIIVALLDRLRLAEDALEPWLHLVSTDQVTRSASLARWLDLYDRMAEEVMQAQFENRPYETARATQTVRGKSIQDDLRKFDRQLEAWRAVAHPEPKP